MKAFSGPGLLQALWGIRLFNYNTAHTSTMFKLDIVQEA